MTVRVGTRRSPLALAQAAWVTARLVAEGAVVETVAITTEGDRRLEARLARVGGKGLFVREIEAALLAGRIDMAVHSLKDLPTELPTGLALAGFPERADPRDVLVARSAGATVASLAAGARVGTSSLRRQALLLAERGDLDVRPLRGNLDTRLARLEASGFDAVVVAAAGLERLGFGTARGVALPAERFVPAVGQGILALEVRADHAAGVALAQRLDHAPTRAAALAERAFLRTLGATCASAVGGYAAPGRDAHELFMVGVVAREDGALVLRAALRGAASDAERLGETVAERLLADGASDLLGGLSGAAA